jgi:YVTN family beta-propeller protein
MLWSWLVGALLVSTSLAQSPARLEREVEVPLPGVTGRIDHMAISPDGKRLYVAALGNNTVEVVDTARGSRISTIRDIAEPQGVRVLSGGEVAVSSASDECVRFYSGEGKVVQTIKDLPDADNLRLDEKAGLLYVGYGKGAVAAIDPVKREKVGEIKVGGHPESFQLESNGPRPRILVNVPDTREIAVLDRTTGKQVATWKLEDAAANFPMALDEGHHRLFVVCRKPARLMVMDTESGRRVAEMPCVGDADDLFYDADLARLYITGGEGKLQVISQSDPDHYALLQEIETSPGARTSYWSSQERRLWVAAPQRGERQAKLLVFRASR